MLPSFPKTHPLVWREKKVSLDRLDAFLDQQAEVDYQRRMKEWQKSAAIRLMPNAKKAIKEFSYKNGRLRFHLQNLEKYRKKYALPFTISSAYNPPATSWQLASGHFMPHKMTMTVVHPRPDAELSTLARQSYAYADGATEYRIPVEVQGGAWPFHYALTAAPAGMSIGADYGNANYGVITWTPSAPSTAQTVTVQITDQDLNTVSVTYTVTPNTDKFLFVDFSAATNGTGTKASPYNTMTGLSVIDTNGTPSVSYGKLIYFRAGSGSFTGAQANGNYSIKNSVNGKIFIGYPGETCSLDFSTCGIINTDEHDFWFSELNATNARSDGGVLVEGQTNATFIYHPQANVQNRITIWKNNFSNITYNSGGDPNQAVATFGNPGVLRNYFVYCDNTLSSYSVAHINTYAIKYAVIDNNSESTATAQPPAGLFYLKSDIQYISCRENTSIGQIFGFGAFNIPMQSQNNACDYIELAYNIMLPGTGHPSVAISQSTPGVSENVRLYIYRNTFNGQIGGYDTSPCVVLEESNVLIDNATANGWSVVTGTNQTITAGTSPNDNLTGVAADNIINTSTGDLNPAYSSYEGTKGYKIV